MADTTAVPDAPKPPAVEAAPLWGVSIEFLAGEPHRAAERSYFPYNVVIGFGRDHDPSGQPRAEIVRRRLGLVQVRHPIKTLTISKLQFLFEGTEHALLVTNRGRNAMCVNGQRVDTARLREDDRVSVLDQMILLVVREPPELPAGQFDMARFAGPFGEPLTLEDLVGESGAFYEMMNQLTLAAASGKPVLIVGDSGTGKQAAARFVYHVSKYAGGPWIEENAASLPEAVAAKLLFGNTRDWLNGREEPSPGLFGAADGGALFIDEFGDLHPDVQAMLLTVLQEKRFLPKGATKPRHVDCLFIAATNKPLDALRHDLRRRFIVVQVPTLDERRDDWALLARRIISRARERGDLRAQNTDNLPLVLEHLLGKSMPGNVRQLEDELLDGLFDLKRLKPAEALPSAASVVSADEPITETLVRALLHEHHGNQAAVQRALGVTRAWLRAFMKRHGIT
jgi:transcriptional regulator of acetoin/glycerol metabolism